MSCLVIVFCMRTGALVAYLATASARKFPGILAPGTHRIFIFLSFPASLLLMFATVESLLVIFFIASIHDFLFVQPRNLLVVEAA